MINAAIVAGATVVLAVTPATVGYPIKVEEAVVLVDGVLLVASANALVLKVSFGALDISVSSRFGARNDVAPIDELIDCPVRRAAVTTISC